MIRLNFIYLVLNFFDFFQQKKIFNFLKKRIPSNSILFDVGAHHGETILNFKSLTNIAAPNRSRFFAISFWFSEKKNVERRVKRASFAKIDILHSETVSAFLTSARKSSQLVVNFDFAKNG